MTTARPNRGTAFGLVTAAILGIAIISQPTLAHAAHGGGGFHGGGFHGGGFPGGGVPGGGVSRGGVYRRYRCGHGGRYGRGGGGAQPAISTPRPPGCWYKPLSGLFAR